jgi:hypothetical protein
MKEDRAYALAVILPLANVLGSCGIHRDTVLSESSVLLLIHLPHIELIASLNERLNK